MTASFGNFVASLFAGGLIAVGIGVVLVYISTKDRLTRNF